MGHLKLIFIAGELWAPKGSIVFNQPTVVYFAVLKNIFMVTFARIKEIAFHEPDHFHKLDLMDQPALLTGSVLDFFVGFLKTYISVGITLIFI